mmetsp:Transcript_2136/g.4370  ORF Transcript_2136/g.4370 Transcript_2136/m.4370 type:complete len:373 (-) Transcript_2136:337-1455(-)
MNNTSESNYLLILIHKLVTNYSASTKKESSSSSSALLSLLLSLSLLLLLLSSFLLPAFEEGGAFAAFFFLKGEAPLFASSSLLSSLLSSSSSSSSLASSPSSIAPPFVLRASAQVSRSLTALSEACVSALATSRAASVDKLTRSRSRASPGSTHADAGSTSSTHASPATTLPPPALSAPAFCFLRSLDFFFFCFCPSLPASLWPCSSAPHSCSLHLASQRSNAIKGTRVALCSFRRRRYRLRRLLALRSRCMWSHGAGDPADFNSSGDAAFPSHQEGDARSTLCGVLAPLSHNEPSPGSSSRFRLLASRFKAFSASSASFTAASASATSASVETTHALQRCFPSPFLIWFLLKDALGSSCLHPAHSNSERRW